MTNPNSGNKNPPNTGTSRNTPTSTAPNPVPALAPKLRKDSRLTQEERQCCMDNNLCLFCSKPGHIATNCSKAAAAKACTATVSTTPDNNSVTMESKN